MTTNELPAHKLPPDKARPLISQGNKDLRAYMENEANKLVVQQGITKMQAQHLMQAIVVGVGISIQQAYGYSTPNVSKQPKPEEIN